MTQPRKELVSEIYTVAFGAFQRRNVDRLSQFQIFGHFNLPEQGALRQTFGKNPGGLREFLLENFPSKFRLCSDGQTLLSLAMERQLKNQAYKSTSNSEGVTKSASNSSIPSRSSHSSTNNGQSQATFDLADAIEEVYRVLRNSFAKRETDTLPLSSLAGYFSTHPRAREAYGYSPQNLGEFIAGYCSNEFAFDGEMVYHLLYKPAPPSIDTATIEAVRLRLDNAFDMRLTAKLRLCDLLIYFSSKDFFKIIGGTEEGLRKFIQDHLSQKYEIRDADLVVLLGCEADRPSIGNLPAQRPAGLDGVKTRVLNILEEAYDIRQCDKLGINQLIGYFATDAVARTAVGKNAAGLERYIVDNFPLHFKVDANGTVTQIGSKYAPVQKSHKQRDEAFMMRKERENVASPTEWYDLEMEDSVTLKILAILKLLEEKLRTVCGPFELSLNRCSVSITELLDYTYGQTRPETWRYFAGDGAADKEYFENFLRKRTHAFEVSNKMVKRVNSEFFSSILALNDIVRRKEIRPFSQLLMIFRSSNKIAASLKTAYAGEERVFLEFLKKHSWIFNLSFADTQVTSKRILPDLKPSRIDEIASDMGSLCAQIGLSEPDGSILNGGTKPPASKPQPKQHAPPKMPVAPERSKVKETKTKDPSVNLSSKAPKAPITVEIPIPKSSTINRSLEAEQSSAKDSKSDRMLGGGAFATKSATTAIIPEKGENSNTELGGKGAKRSKKRDSSTGKPIGLESQVHPLKNSDNLIGSNAVIKPPGLESPAKPLKNLDNLAGSYAAVKPPGFESPVKPLMNLENKTGSNATIKPSNMTEPSPASDVKVGETGLTEKFKVKLKMNLTAPKPGPEPEELSPNADDDWEALERDIEEELDVSVPNDDSKSTSAEAQKSTSLGVPAKTSPPQTKDSSGPSSVFKFFAASPKGTKKEKAAPPTNGNLPLEPTWRMPYFGPQKPTGKGTAKAASEAPVGNRNPVSHNSSKASPESAFRTSSADRQLGKNVRIYEPPPPTHANGNQLNSSSFKSALLADKRAMELLEKQNAAAGQKLPVDIMVSLGTSKGVRRRGSKSNQTSQDSTRTPSPPEPELGTDALAEIPDQNSPGSALPPGFAEVIQEQISGKLPTASDFIGCSESIPEYRSTGESVSYGPPANIQQNPVLETAPSHCTACGRPNLGASQSVACQESGPVLTAATVQTDARATADSAAQADFSQSAGPKLTLDAYTQTVATGDELLNKLKNKMRPQFASIVRS